MNKGQIRFPIFVTGLAVSGLALLTYSARNLIEKAPVYGDLVVAVILLMAYFVYSLFICRAWLYTRVGRRLGVRVAFWIFREAGIRSVLYGYSLRLSGDLSIGSYGENDIVRNSEITLNGVPLFLGVDVDTKKSSGTSPADTISDSEAVNRLIDQTKQNPDDV
jgi:hypothetical protein